MTRVSQRCSSLTAKHLPCCCCCARCRPRAPPCRVPLLHNIHASFSSNNQVSQPASQLARCRVAAAASQQAHSTIVACLFLSVAADLLPVRSWILADLLIFLAAQLRGQRLEACLSTDILLPSHHPSLALSAICRCLSSSSAPSRSLSLSHQHQHQPRGPR